MQQTLRPYVTAGIAIVGCGLIAATPVAPPGAGGPVNRDIALTDWVEQFNTAADNAGQLLNNFLLAPGVGFQQLLVNQSEFWDSIVNDPATIPAVMQQMQENLDAVLTGFTLINASGGVDFTDGLIGTVGDVIPHTMTGTDILTFDFGHDLLFSFIPGLLPPDEAEALAPLINFLASPLSAILIGSLGPSIAPWVALSNSISDGDFLGILPNMIGAYFNGATLDLDWLIPLIEESGLLPIPEGSLNSLEFAFGGLLSAGTVGAGPWELADGEDDIIASIPAVGGSIFNSLGLGLDAEPLLGLPLEIDIAGEGIGPIGAWLAWDQIVGALLGSGWDGKGATVVTPPIFGFDLITNDLFDDGGVGEGVATSLQDMLAGLLSG